MILFLQTVHKTIENIIYIYVDLYYVIKNKLFRHSVVFQLHVLFYISPISFHIRKSALCYRYLQLQLTVKCKCSSQSTFPCLIFYFVF